MASAVQCGSLVLPRVLKTLGSFSAAAFAGYGGGCSVSSWRQLLGSLLTHLSRAHALTALDADSRKEISGKIADLLLASLQLPAAPPVRGTLATELIAGLDLALRDLYEAGVSVRS